MVPPVQNIQENIQIFAKAPNNYTAAALPCEYIDINLTGANFEDDSEHIQLNCDGLSYPFNATAVIRAPIENAEYLYDGDLTNKKFIEVTINITNVSDYQFLPGDSIGILVSNSKVDVDMVLMRLSMYETSEVNCDISIKPRTAKKNAKVPQHIPKCASPRAILRDCLDLRSIPKKLFLRSLAEYTTDNDEKNQLLSMSSKEGTNLYNEYILEKARTFLDILNIYASCCPPLSLLIEHLPRLKPRPYSIANSPLVDAGKIKIILSVLSEKPGVATAFLAEKVERFLESPEKQQKISFYFRERNNFSYNAEDAYNDNILIAVGCSVSPFLGFLEHKDLLMNQENTRQNKELGATWLFVGSTCQESAVHREQLLDYQIRGVLQHLYESFSRDPECNDFIHVQDQLKENASDFVEQFLKKNTTLYVCADGAKISKSIENCIKECLSEILECSGEEAEKIIKESRISGNYREDIWV